MTYPSGPRAYCVTYDLKTPGRNYTALFEALKQSPKWWHYLQSTWLIQTTETPDQVWGRLVQQIDRTDFLLIIEVRRSTQGWLPKDAWDWITQNVPEP